MVLHGSIGRRSPIISAFVLMFLWITASCAYPTEQNDRLVARQAPGAGINLRLIPIGDSITKGYLSPDYNGYRLILRNMLLIAGFPNPDFIGSQADGSNNPDNQHEGWGGYRISEIRNAMTNAQTLKKHPNLALIHAGTNDLFSDPPKEPFDSAPDRLGQLIDTVLAEDPEAVVLVAKIMKIGGDGQTARVNAFNARVPGIVAARANRGYKVRVVDHSYIGGSEETVEGVHPNKKGCEKMAQAWYQAIIDVPKSWWATPRAPA